MKESILTSIKEDKEFFILNHELNEKIIKEYLFENIIKKLTIEDMDDLVNITIGDAKSLEDNSFLVGFNLFFKGRFTLNDRMNMMDNLVVQEEFIKSDW